METGSCRWDPSQTRPENPEFFIPSPDRKSSPRPQLHLRQRQRLQPAAMSKNHGNLMEIMEEETGISHDFTDLPGYFWWLTSSSGNPIKARWDQQDLFTSKNVGIDFRSTDGTEDVPTWWLIPLSKWDITPVINGISRVNPLIIGVITHLLSEMSHQV